MHQYRSKNQSELAIQKKTAKRDITAAPVIITTLPLFSEEETILKCGGRCIHSDCLRLYTLGTRTTQRVVDTLGQDCPSAYTTPTFGHL